MIRCGEAPAEADGEAPAEAHRSLGSRLWLYTNFDCNLRCDYCCVRSSPKAPRRALGLVRVRRIASEAAALGVGEIFVTGGEPFLLADIGDILAACTATAPTTVLTNGMLLVGRRLETLRGIAARSPDIADQPRQPDARAPRPTSRSRYMGQSVEGYRAGAGRRISGATGGDSCDRSRGR